MRTLSDLMNSDDAASEVIGYMLIFGMVITMVGIIFIVAMPSIEDAQGSAYIESIKRGITVLDSKTSMVALGESPSQTINIDSKGGIFGVDENASYITITMDGTITPIFKGTLGTLTYELDDTVIAYEGGGVWMKYPKGDPVMISPPKFQYNDGTLALSIMRLRGQKAISGTGSTQIKVAKSGSEISYPNIAKNSSFTNPVAYDRDVLVTIQSDYYKAWAKYLDERTEAYGITTDDSNRKVSAKLNIKPSAVEVDPAENVIIYDIDENMPEPITMFKLDLTAVDLTSSPNPLNLEIKTSDAINPQLIIKLEEVELEEKDKQKEKPKKEGGPNMYRIYLTYEDDYADGNYAEEWKSDSFSGDIITQKFDLLTNIAVSYDNPPHRPSESWGNNQYTSEPGIDYDTKIKDGDKKNANEYGKIKAKDVSTLENIIKHYMAIMPAPFEFVAYDGITHEVLPSSNEALQPAGTLPKPTYLHIVEHDIAVDIS